MGWFTAPEYWLGRLILERGVAADLCDSHSSRPHDSSAR